MIGEQTAPYLAPCLLVAAAEVAEDDIDNRISVR